MIRIVFAFAFVLAFAGCDPAHFVLDDVCEWFDRDGDGSVVAYEAWDSREDPGAPRVWDACTHDSFLANLPEEVSQDCLDDPELARSATVWPGAPELCDGEDNDCDFEPEVDADGDGFPVDVLDCVADCDDAVAEVNPDAAEVCNGRDDDCDLVVDEGLDQDGDGLTPCAGDCDDADPSVRPALPEGCDGIDTDCDGALGIDELDDDGDAFTECAGDCDDDNATIHPGAEEACDGLDTDCSGSVELGENDADGDGSRACLDCDDADPFNAPNWLEACDGADNDCDGLVDEGLDGDGDGVTPCAGDCDDADASVFPGATEACDGADDDCDGVVPADELDLDADLYAPCEGDCDDTDAFVGPLSPEQCNGVDDDCDGVVPADELDLDGDGSSTCSGDCDDGDPAANLFDLDSDGLTPCAGDCDDLDATMNGLDADADGASTCDGDCDDLAPTIGPGQQELCNESDDNCNGLVDEAFPDLNGDSIADCIELCDGVDNDGDGLTDEGFSGAGGLGTIVSASAGSASGAGTWLDPLNSIPLAIGRSLTTNPCPVLVQPGTYGAQIVLPSSPVTIESTAGPELTVLDGSTVSPLLVAGAGVARSTVIDGFGFVGAALLDTAGTGDPLLRNGAAVQVRGGSPTLRCNRFEANTSVDGGGALWIQAGAPLIEDSLFFDNESLGSGFVDGGGAVLVADGAGSGIEITGSTFLANSSGGNGGALAVRPGNDLTISSSRFAGNSAGGFGGAAALIESDVDVDGLLFQCNGGTSGGGIWSVAQATTVTLAHATFVENSANSGMGGAVSFEGNGSVLTDSILTWPTLGGLLGWTTPGASIQPDPSITWDLLWDAAGGGLFSNFGPPISDAVGTDGNLGLDPLFTSFDADCDSLDDDLTLLPPSPARNAGDPDPSMNDADGSRSDLGGLGGAAPYEPAPTCFGALP